MNIKIEKSVLQNKKYILYQSKELYGYIKSVSYIGTYEGKANWYMIWLNDEYSLSLNLYTPLKSKFKPRIGKKYYFVTNGYGDIIEMYNANDSCCIIV